MKVIEPNVTLLKPSTSGGNPILEHLERCGRICYKSERKIEPGSAERFVRGIVARGHLSVTEHFRFIVEVTRSCYCSLLAVQPKFLTMTCAYGRCIVSGSFRAFLDLYNQCRCRPNKYIAFGDNWVAATYYLAPIINEISRHYECGILLGDEKVGPCNITGNGVVVLRFLEPEDLSGDELLAHGWATLHFVCDRGISHELVRHRVMSVSQESTRFCNYSNGQFGGETTMIRPLWIAPGSKAYKVWWALCKETEDTYFKLLNWGWSPQQARDILPTSLKTELVMTGTYSQWRHLFELRACDKFGVAHPQMKQVAAMALEVAKKHTPNVFDDLQSVSNPQDTKCTTK